MVGGRGSTVPREAGRPGISGRLVAKPMGGPSGKVPPEGRMEKRRLRMRSIDCHRIYRKSIAEGAELGTTGRKKP